MPAETQPAQERPPNLIILGAARSEGNTADAVRRLVSTLPYTMTGVVDLTKCKIALFDYETSQTNDDFFDVWLLATGAGEDLPPGFEEPFRLTAKYFNMHYRGHVYVRYENGDSISENQIPLIETFRQSIFS